MSQSTLPPLDESRKGQIALLLLTEEMVISGDFLRKPNNTRRELAARAKLLEVDPNELLSLLQELLKPNLEELFKPITNEEVVQFEAEREEKRKQREARRNQG